MILLGVAGARYCALSSAIRSPPSRAISVPSTRPHTGSPACSTRTRRCVSATGMAHNVSILRRTCQALKSNNVCITVSPMLQVDSVVDLAYERIRGLVLDGDIAPGARLGQVELAERLGVSRTPVREALRRLAGEGLVDFQDQRGFRVAALPLGSVLHRLEVRLALEPACARLAAERRTDADLAALGASIAEEQRARSAVAAHDASRAFHVRVATATHNDEFVTALEGLWIVEIGRR